MCLCVCVCTHAHVRTVARSPELGAGSPGIGVESHPARHPLQDHQPLSPSESLSAPKMPSSLTNIPPLPRALSGKPQSYGKQQSAEPWLSYAHPLLDLLHLGEGLWPSSGKQHCAACRSENMSLTPAHTLKGRAQRISLQSQCGTGRNRRILGGLLRGPASGC